MQQTATGALGVTAVIPTFRRPRLLRRAITSAVSQEGVDVTVAVFDNCSGDETADVVSAIAQRYPGVRYHRHPANIGAIANFKAGVDSVTTPFFSILSDDDYLLPGFYQRALAGFAEHPEAMFWAGVTLNVDEHGTIWDARLNRWPREGLYPPPQGALQMTGGLAPTWTGIVFRREVLERAGFIDPETLGPSDLDYTLRLGARFPFVFEKVPVAVFSIHGSGFSATQPLSSFWPGWLRMIENIKAMPGLMDADRERLLTALNADARRMLFRRGANALAAARLDFARAAAAVLSEHYGQTVRSGLLRAMAEGCETIPGGQRLVTACYRLLERRLVASRADLQRTHGHLLLKGD